MSKKSPFTIYNASAGSGKTFTLVKEYLKILFRSNHPLAFKNVLALTFTNKAVAEMKERIINTLKEFSSDGIVEHPTPMFTSIVEEIGIEPSLLNKRSKFILETMVHNYASFDVSTIDKFNHKLIRTFAHDLKLPLNFEVELDTTSMLSKAVDRLIDKAGTDKELTKILVDFAIEKADDDKSWDVSLDFKNIAKLLISENDIPSIANLKSKKLEDFKHLKTQLISSSKILETEIMELAQNTLELIVNQGLQFDDFSGSYLPKHFQKLVDGNFNVNFGLAWQNKLIEGASLYPTRVSNDVKSIIDSIQNQLIDFFDDSYAKITKSIFINNALKNITPLSVLYAIDTSLTEIKKEEDLLLISEFNSIISNEINAQPAPFIYERIGEKFKHYFIDEFQDTSQLQWENLIPLVSNALSGENLKGETGSAMIVGDAKQAIYRWRGGKAEQFIDLYADENPFFVDKHVQNLPNNFRSLKQVVTFNNSFFGHLSDLSFSLNQHQTIYKNSSQVHSKLEEGLVELTFLDLQDEDKNELHCQMVLETIHKVLSRGFELKDICIIARKTKEGMAVAEYLSCHDIPIISSESLLLQNSPEVNFMVSITALATQPNNSELKIAVLEYLAEFKLNLSDKHAFFETLINLETPLLFGALKDYGYHFNFETFVQSPLYEATETIIRQFNLNHASDAYLQFYMDEVLNYSQKQTSSFSSFITHWENKKEKLSIVSPKGNNAVQIMTIHRSKGLEFPVVIFPYANQDIYFDMSPKTWYSVEKSDYNDFSQLYMNLNKDMEGFGEQGQNIYKTYRSALELDTINLLYVVLTRAVEQLYIISELDLTPKQEEKLNTYSGLFINYLKSIGEWKDSESVYKFGNPKKQLTTKTNGITVKKAQFISTPKEDHHLNIITNGGYLWDTDQEKAMEKGNLIHTMMSKINTLLDIDSVVKEFHDSGKLNSLQECEIKQMLLKIVTHTDLKQYFTEELTIYNEKDIITKEGEILRPDRIVVNSSMEAVIIDYKTGNEKPSHMLQLDRYQQILKEMDFKVFKKILIYINKDIQIKEF